MNKTESSTRGSGPEDGRAIEAMSDQELQDIHSRVCYKLSRRYLNSTEKTTDAEKREIEALELHEKALDKEIERRSETGDVVRKLYQPAGEQSLPRTPEGIMRFGTIGAKYRELFHGRKDAHLDRTVDIEEFCVSAAAKQPLDKRTLQESAGTDAGFSVPEIWAAGIYDSVLEESIMLSKVRVYPMQTNVLHIPAWDSTDKVQGPYASVACEMIGETTSATLTTPQMRVINLIAKKMGLAFNTSREVYEDSGSLAASLDPLIRNSLNYYLDQKIIRGSGTGEALGIINSPAKISIGRNAAGQVGYTDISAMAGRLHPAFWKNAIWLASPSVLVQLLRMVDGGSRYIWAPNMAAGVASAVPGFLLGRPLYLTDHCNQLGEASDIVFCDPSVYGLGMRREIVIFTTADAYFLQDLITWKGLVRFDGTGLLNEAIRPANSTTTLSWVVDLQA